MSDERSYPELSEDMQARGLGAMLRIFGPGAIIASVTIGSGETVFASRAARYSATPCCGALSAVV